MLPIAALILTDRTAGRFLGTDLNERAALSAYRAGIDHVFFLGDLLPDEDMRHRLQAEGLAVSIAPGWSKPLTGAPPARLLVVIPARTVVDPSALKAILRVAADTPGEPALAVDTRPEARQQFLTVSDGFVTSVQGDGNAATTGIAVLPIASIDRVRTARDMRDALHRLSKAGALRAVPVTGADGFCMALPETFNLTSVERAYVRETTSGSFSLPIARELVRVAVSALAAGFQMFGGSLARAVSLMSLLLALAAPAAAFDGEQEPQDQNRAGLLAAERDKKAGEVTPPERSFVERKLYWYDNQVLLEKTATGWHGVTFAGGSFPAGAGTGVGARFTRGTRVQFETMAAYTTRGYKRADASVTARSLGSAPIDLRVRAQAYEHPQEDFFGFGHDSRSEDRTNYLLEGAEAGADVVWKPATVLHIGGGVSFASNTNGSGTDSRFPSTEEVFDPATIAGFGTQLDFLRSDASIAFDWRDNPSHTHAGGRYGVRFSDFRDQDLDAYSFRRVEIDVQQFVPLPDRYRTLALHARCHLHRPGGGQRRAVLLSADARRRPDAARLPRVPFPRPQQPVHDRRVPLGGVVDARRRVLRRRRQGGHTPAAI